MNVRFIHRDAIRTDFQALLTRIHPLIFRILGAI